MTRWITLLVVGSLTLCGTLLDAAECSVPHRAPAGIPAPRHGNACRARAAAET